MATATVPLNSLPHLLIAIESQGLTVSNTTRSFVLVLWKTQMIVFTHSKLQDTAPNIQDNAAQSL